MIEKKLTGWDLFLRIAKVLEFIAMLGGMVALICVPFQIQNLINTGTQNGFELMTLMEKQLNSKVNSDIQTAIDRHKPVLNVNKGRYSENELDDFLNNFETLGSYFKKKLISLDMLCAWFGDPVSSVISNQEIGEYIKKSRNEDSAYFEDFIFLQKTLQSGCVEKSGKS